MANTRRTAQTDLDRQIARATARGERTRKAGRLAETAQYDPRTRRLMLEMSNGVSVGIPIDWLPEVAKASDEELAKVTVLGAGGIVAWEALDADYSVPALVTTFVGKAIGARELGRLGGSVKSDAKSAAARANGAKGGRPRKNVKKAATARASART